MLLVSLLPAAPASAQDSRCFSATGYCISGEIRRFWEQNGGLPVFGYPITPQQRETIEGRNLEVQWFERNRLELHPELPWPARVQLGRLGADLLARQGRDWSVGASEPQAGCRFFSETGRNVCGAMLSRWRAAGIESDGRRGLSEAENLALIGLPLTDVQAEYLSDGRMYQVQWFERARMEWHPELPGGGGVLLGLLGTEYGPQALSGPAIRVAPLRLQVPLINLDHPITAVGLDRNGVPIVPDHDIGWYELSAAPGAGENIVLWGHVLRFRHAPDLPAPFAHLKDVPVGARITLINQDGERFAYVVSRQIWVTPDQVQYILPQGREMVTMVSCIGDQVIEDGEVTDMTHRLITIAEPVR
ncbi:MAG: class F sortase [Oscillochloris sp.]|nr:class F sortase [Oscillochloris sp.]